MVSGRLIAWIAAFAGPGCWGALAAEVTISQSQLEHLEIRLEEVRAASDEAVALLPGTVIPPTNSRIAVPSPFAGTVISVDVLPGETVKKGRELMTIASREFVESLSQLRQAEANLAAAAAVASRYRTLADKNIAAPTRATETEAQRDGLKAVVEQHRRLVSLGNIRMNEDGTYTLVAQQDGRVVEASVTAGSHVEAMAAAAVIDTTDELWVEAQLPAALLGKVRAGDSIHLNDDVIGKVLSVVHSIDPKTRSARLIGQIPASSGFAVGQMVTLSVHRAAPSASFDVPSQAVVYLAGKPKVFLRTNNGFTAVPVTLRGKTLHGATIEGEIVAGQKVAVSGLAQLENMMGAE
ncbi:efflux transporter periplasmic adaptor subunit [Hyphomicrobium methylovorum]|uniref:efflux RND transporter periplasmic adaptor subunit n=1 Tax=Hyphomicrobium methylovorum TaxID=84 RepID=UPI0015E6F455|nr:efflux RND transporter periplasmic adaptor subunit [Hyphomicrobium methylovorum]MBA2125893.1 efflux transporter periplasmic adaptor subunit [Hyphomicrobium methylovorum]